MSAAEDKSASPDADEAAPRSRSASAGADAERSFGPLRAIGWIFALGFLAAGLLIGALAYRIVAPDPEPEEVVRVVRETPDVIVAVKDLARLETAEFHVERVIDIKEDQRALFGLVEASDAILLVAAADVAAGVDLTKMQDGDVVIDPENMTAEITLPAPEIFSARLDNERTYVHTRATDALAQRNEALETQARQEAERDLRQSALDGGILQRARRNAEIAIRTLVRSLGYDRVVIVWRDEAGIENPSIPTTNEH